VKCPYGAVPNVDVSHAWLFHVHKSDKQLFEMMEDIKDGLRTSWLFFLKLGHVAWNNLSWARKRNLAYRNTHINNRRYTYKQ